MCVFETCCYSVRVYEQPSLLQPNPETLVLEAHIHANPKPKVITMILSDVTPFASKCGDMNKYPPPSPPEIAAKLRTS